MKRTNQSAIFLDFWVLGSKFTKSYLSWQWRVMESLNKNFLVVSLSNLTCGIWWIFITSFKSLKICTFMWSFSPKDKMLQLENFRGIICLGIEGWCKVLNKTDLWLQKWHKVVNFHASKKKSQNLHFHWIHLSKAYKNLDGKIQKSYVSWHFRAMQSFLKRWIFIPKKTWEIQWILTQPLKSPNI